MPYIHHIADFIRLRAVHDHDIILRSHSGSNFRLCPRACFLNSCFSLGPIMPLVDCIVAMNTLMVLGVYEQDGFEKSQAKYAKAAKLVRKLRNGQRIVVITVAVSCRLAFTKKKWWAKARLRVKKGVQKRIMKLAREVEERRAEAGS